ncbi:hypothetical protein KDH_42960 [Dictyobacter sp. S3.2.2.5]|uniref:Uncharacterized protein n=1 Tax=Dictyobacter halimunensis TaxID=3026934 RepID=A0ABQ6FWS9_9CHLR|nr:hypothetical protein KDH_42960 [Dictyobacter sp. S3.2.2.5]
MVVLQSMRYSAWIAAQLEKEIGGVSAPTLAGTKIPNGDVSSLTPHLLPTSYSRCIIMYDNRLIRSTVK